MDIRFTGYSLKDIETIRMDLTKKNPGVNYTASDAVRNTISNKAIEIRKNTENELLKGKKEEE